VGDEQVLDNYLRQRAAGNGAKLYNGLFLRMEQKEGEEGPFTINFSNYEDGGKARFGMSPSPDLVARLLVVQEPSAAPCPLSRHRAA
jgi:hypothetical protein